MIQLPSGVLPRRTRLRNYEIERVLGQGGFGITYSARDIQLDRTVAIKEYLPAAIAMRGRDLQVQARAIEHQGDLDWGRKRFLDEARTLAKLGRVPGIVRVHDFLEANGTAYMVMELIDGETLASRLRREKQLPPSAILQFLDPLLDGLEQVHEAGFLHRDIKPPNIMLDQRGNCMLIDFGASRAAVAGRLTSLSTILTPEYAAIEQWSTMGQGPWTDIYGFAATLHQLVTGALPPNAYRRTQQDTYTPVAGLVGTGYPFALLAGIDAGLALRAADRPQSIAAWRSILGRSRRAASPRPSQRWRGAFNVTRPIVNRRLCLNVGSIAVLVVALVVGRLLTTTPAPGTNARAAGGQLSFHSCEENAANFDDLMAKCAAVIASGTAHGRELAIAHAGRGAGRWIKGEKEAGLQDLNRAIAIDPTYAEAFVRRGLAYFQSYQMDRALQDYDQALKLEPDNLDALSCRGDVYAGKGQNDLALQDYNHALRLNTEFYPAIANRALAYANQGHRTEAMDEANRAIALAPKASLAYEVRGSIYRMIGQLDRALSDYDTAIQYAPKSPIALAGRSAVKRQKGDISGADADAAVARAIDPKVNVPK